MKGLNYLHGKKRAVNPIEIIVDVKKHVILEREGPNSELRGVISNMQWQKKSHCDQGDSHMHRHTWCANIQANFCPPRWPHPLPSHVWAIQGSRV